MAPLSTDAQSFDLTIELDEAETQGEVTAECGCTLERTEFSIGFTFCDFHRSAQEMRERFLAERAETRG